jgi:lysophospholipase L1-like esterase
MNIRSANLYLVAAIILSALSIIIAIRASCSRPGVEVEDFIGLGKYRTENADLASHVDRTVFIGDSITELWNLSQYFNGKGYLNRGIVGQTTFQLLLRFHQDVVELHPRAVVILAGINDVGGKAGQVSISEIESNYLAMAEIARSNGIKVVFCSLLPIHNYFPTRKVKIENYSRERIIALNSWLRDYCFNSGAVYVDYFSAMIDAHASMRRDLSDDGLHPNDKGYQVMASVLASAIPGVL